MTRANSELTAAIEDVETATTDLAEPMETLNAQLSELTEQMGEVADGMAAFDRPGYRPETMGASAGHDVASD
jgi:prefoldin subunit 5